MTTTRQAMFEVVKAKIREIVEVVSRSMKELKIKVPRTELSGARNLKDLLDLFEKSASSATAG